MKYLRYIVGWIIALLAVVALAGVALFESRWVGNKVAEKATELLSRKLETRVEIGAASFKMPGVVDIEDVEIYDQQKRQMLKAARVEASLSFAALWKGDIVIKHISLLDPELSVYADSAGVMNYQFAIDSLAGRSDGESVLQVKLKTVTCHDLALRYESPADSLGIEELSLSARIDCMEPDSISLRMRSLRGKIVGGPEVKKLRFRLLLGLETGTLKDFELKTTRSRVRIEKAIVANCGHDGKINLKRAYLRAASTEWDVAPADFAMLEERLGSFGEQSVAFQANFRGDSLEMYAYVRPVSERSLVDMDVNVRVLLNGRKRIKADVRNLRASAEAIEGLRPFVGEELAGIMEQTGEVSYKGRLSYEKGGELEGKGELFTRLGAIDCSMGFNQGEINGSVGLKDFDLGGLLAFSPEERLKKLGRVTAYLEASGRVEPFDMQASVDLQSVECGDYQLAAVKADATVEGEDVSVNLNCGDPKVAFASAIAYNLKTGALVATADVDAFYAAELGLTADTLHTSCRATGIKLSASLPADGQATLNSFGLETLTVSSDTGNISTGAMVLERTAKGSLVRTTLKSEIAEALFVGDVEPMDAPALFVQVVSNSLPSLAEKLPKPLDGYHTIDFNLTVKDLRFMQSLFSLPFELQDEAHITGHADSRTNKLGFTFDCSQFSLFGSPYADATIFMSTRHDSLITLWQIEKLFGDEPVKFVLSTTADLDTLNAKFDWLTPQSSATRGTLNFCSAFSQDSDGHASVRLQILPSSIYIQDSLWTLSPAVIELANNTYTIDNFSLSHENHLLSIQTLPYTMRSGQPALSAQLSDIDLEYVFNLINFHPVRFEGLASGTVQSVAVGESDNLSIDISARDFRFNGSPMGTLDIEGSFLLDESKLLFDAMTYNPGHRDSTIIKGMVDIAHDSLDIGFTPVLADMRFLDKYLHNVMSDLRGACTGELRLYGPTGKLNLVGYAVLDSLLLTPRALNTEFSFDRDTIFLEPGKMIFSNATMRDPYYGEASINGAVSHSHLHAFRYNFDFHASSLLAYDWSGFETTGFWGTVRATGDCRLYGDEDAVQIDAMLTTNEGSSFVYDASNPDEVGEEPFIRFRSRRQAQVGVSDVKTDSLEMASLTQDDRTDIYFNLQINATPDIEVDIITDAKTGEVMRLHGSGDITANYYNKGRMSLYGIYTLVDGSYEITIQDLLHRRFVMQPGGTFSFNGLASQGDINMQGVYRINSVSLSDLNIGNFSSNTVPVNCLLNFSGKVLSPQISFDLDFPSSGEDEKLMVRNIIEAQGDITMQAVYLLTVGRFYTYNYSDFASANSGNQSTRAMQSILANTLSGQINRILQNLLQVDNWSFGTNIATGRYGWDDVEIEAQLAGRLFGNRLLINGSFGYRDNSLATYVNDFVGDFNVQWVLNRSRTISLKAYSETNDRYFTHSTLITSGAGVLFSRDFTKLRYFFSDFWNLDK